MLSILNTHAYTKLGQEETFGGDDIFTNLMVIIVSWMYIICPNSSNGIQ